MMMMMMMMIVRHRQNDGKQTRNPSKRKCTRATDHSGGTPSNINVIYTGTACFPIPALFDASLSSGGFNLLVYRKTTGIGLLHGENWMILTSTVFD